MAALNANIDPAPMMNLLLSDPRDRHIRRAVLTLLLGGVVSTLFITVMHRLEPDPHPLNLLVPPLMMAVVILLWLILYFFPSTVRIVLWTVLLGMLLALLLSTWTFSYQAMQNPDQGLMALLPPVIPALFPVLTCMLIFFRGRSALLITLFSWLLITLPVLAYLWWHPEELWSPRGMDIMVMLLPVSLLILAMIPLQYSFDQRLLHLQNERSSWRWLALRDSLTTLYNRRAGEEFLHEILDRPVPEGGVIMFDLDYFKRINDTHGHHVGDDVLCEIARRCKRQLRRDDLLARWGGEEFLAVIDEANDNILLRIAEGLQKTVSGEPIEPVGRVTASFGIATIRRGEPLPALLARADEALYAAKNEGRDRVVRG